MNSNTTSSHPFKNVLFALSTLRLGLISVFVLAASQMLTVEARITNESKFNNLIVPYNHYS